MKKIILTINSYKHNTSIIPFFNNLNIELPGDDIIFLIGMSGSGKTTLLRILLNMETGKFQGKVDFFTCGQKYKIDELYKAGKIGFMSQNPNLIPWITVWENLNIPNKLNEFLAIPKRSTVLYFMEKVGLSIKVLKQYPHELSFGMQMRISFIRLLLYNPKFIFLDEFFTGVDEINKRLLYDILKEYVKKYNVFCLAITHAIDNILKLNNQILVLTNDSKKIIKLDSKVNKSTILQILKQ